jgi:hypothetical protein
LKPYNRLWAVEVIKDLLKENVEIGGHFLIGGDGSGCLKGIIRRRVLDVYFVDAGLFVLRDSEDVDDEVAVLTHKIEADHFL